MILQLLEYPWQLVGTNLFEIDGMRTHYVLPVDSFSRHPDVIQLILELCLLQWSEHLIKSVFSRHGIPETVQSDNDPQYSLQECAWLGLEWITSSPRFPQSNGQVERTIQTVKKLLKKSIDLFLALLSFRATPLPWCDLSLAQLIMGKTIWTPIPQTNSC